MRYDRKQLREFQRRLIVWYRRNARDLPWRRTQMPYRILVSEVMLQQTQVDRVQEYYGRFLRRYPTFEALAVAPEPAVREAWDGLGYYARARNLHRTAQLVVNEHGGQLPEDPVLMRRLPGIGRYTVGAVRSIAYGHDAAILDTNAARVLSRVFAVGTRGSKAQRHRRLWELAERVTPEGEAGTFNQGIMDLGATVCRIRNPRCGVCPVRRLCRFAARAGAPTPSAGKGRRAKGRHAKGRRD